MNVSVIIPFSPKHTPSEMLEEAIQSVERQSVDTECIVVEDTNQRGPAWARNQGLKRADTQYVAFLDADDLWVDDKLERQLDEIKSTGAGLCVEGSEMSRSEFIRGVISNEILSLTSSILIDTDQLDVTFEERLERREDHLFLVEAASKAGICFCDDIVEIRKHDEGLSAEASSKLYKEASSEFIEILESRLNLPESHLKLARARVYYNYGRYAHKEQKYRRAVDGLVKSMRIRVAAKTAAALALSCVYLVLDNSITMLKAISR